MQVIPAAIGEVQPPQEGHYLVHHQQLLMMGPQRHLVWVAHHLEEFMREGLGETKTEVVLGGRIQRCKDEMFKEREG